MTDWNWERDEAITAERSLTESERHGPDCRCRSCTLDELDWDERR